MEHYGDITKISGYDLPTVDCVTGGSPCQDLSLAKTGRAGLQGERSNLFYEQIRIIKELRENDRKTNNNRGIYAKPRFMVFENVKGTFTSNGGEDFRKVLEETARITDERAVIPRPTITGGEWNNSGCILGDWWSISWRLHDAKLWGLPQHRERLALIADFNGHAAPELLFEREGVRRVASQNEEERELAEGCRRGANTANKSEEPVMIELGSTKHTVIRNGICPTLKARMGTGGNNVNAVIKNGYLYRLSPLEVERLQGFPDNYTDIGEWIDENGRKRKASDMQRYKALGNSLALPFWYWLLQRISEQYNYTPTLGSLFDGIGGFPLCWEKINGKGSALWASEIDAFATAVTKYHFQNEKNY